MFLRHLIKFCELKRVVEEAEAKLRVEIENRAMASLCLSIPSLKTLAVPYPSAATSSAPSSSSSSAAAAGHPCHLVSCRMLPIPTFGSRLVVSSNRGRAKRQVVRMAPDEEKLTRRNPLDFPIVFLSSFLFYFHEFLNFH